MDHFISLLGRVSLFWIEGSRRVRRGGGDILFTLPWCLVWSPNKAVLRVVCFSLLRGSGTSMDDMEDPDEVKGY